MFQLEHLYMDLQIIPKARVFLFCGFTKKEDVNDKEQKIIALGGQFENIKKFTESCTHVICKQPVLSEIFLGACLTGKWILIPKYIQDCYEQQCWIEEDKYEWESKFITDCSSLFQQRLYNAPKSNRLFVEQNGAEMFKEWKVVVLIDDKVKSSRYIRLLKLGKAEIINTFEIGKHNKNAAITHVFFESLDFEQLHLFHGGIPILRPEYVDSCILVAHVTFPDIQLFQIIIPTTSPFAKAISYPNDEIMRTANRSNCIDFQRNDVINSATTTHFNSDIIRCTDTIYSKEETDVTMEETENFPAHTNTHLHFSSLSALAPDITRHVDKRFKSDRNSLSAANTEGNYINKTTISEMPPGSLNMEPVFNNDTCQFQENYAITNKSTEMRDLTENENRRVESDFSIEENATLADDVTVSRKLLNNENNKNIDAFSRTLNLLHEKGRTKKIPVVNHKLQKVITSYFSTSYKENIKAEEELFNEQNYDCENWKASNTQSKEFRDVNKLCSNNNYSETPKEMSTRNDEVNEIDLCTIDNEEETTKDQPNNFHRHCNVMQHLKNRKINERSKEDGTSAIFDDLLPLIDVCLEESDLEVALDMITSMVCTSYLPHPRVLNTLMFRILEGSYDENICNRTFIILHRIFHLHHPGNNNMGQYYLDSFSLCGKEIVSPWCVLSEIIRNCIGHLTPHNSNSRDAEYLLSFVTDVVVYNFNHFKIRNKCPRRLFLERKGLFPIAVKIFWPVNPTSYGTMNKECKELFQHINTLLTLSIKPDHMFKTLLCLQKLVGIIAECTIFFDPGTQYNAYNRTHAHSLATILLYAVQDPLRNSNELLYLFMETMQCTWLRLLFCHKFLDQNTISLNSASAVSCITLQMIIEDYMQRSPPGNKCRTRNSSSLRGARSKPFPDKRMNYEKSKRQQNSNESCTDINKRNKKGETKLHIACQTGKAEEVRALLSVTGIDVNIQDNAGWTPLHEACLKGYSECVKLLLEWCPPDNDKTKRVKLMTKAENGITPLHDAVRSNSLVIADLLLKQGGRRLLKRCTKDGLTPCNFVVSKEMDELLTSALDYPDMTEEEEDVSTVVIELSSDSDPDEDTSLDVNVYQYLFLIYHMLVSYLTVNRIDEMMEELKFILEKEGGATHIENQSYSGATSRSYNMQIVSKAVGKILNSTKLIYSPEVDARKNDLCFALRLPGVIEGLLQRTNKPCMQGNAVYIALEYLGLKYKL